MDPIFSPDGHSVAFVSYATGLTANPANPAGPNGPGLNLYIRNLTTGATTLVSATPDGAAFQRRGIVAGLQPRRWLAGLHQLGHRFDGQHAGPEPPARRHGGGVQYAQSEHLGEYVRLALGGRTANDRLGVERRPPPSRRSMAPAPSPRRLPPLHRCRRAAWPRNSTAKTSSSPTCPRAQRRSSAPRPSGSSSSGWADELAFSPDGRYLAFTSDAGDLTSNAFESKPPTVPGVAPDSLTMAMWSIDNVFVHDLQTGQTSLASATTGGLLSDGTSGGLIFSPDSQSLFFTSTALDLTSNPPDTE